MEIKGMESSEVYNTLILYTIVLRSQNCQVLGGGLEIYFASLVMKLNRHFYILPKCIIVI